MHLLFPGFFINPLSDVDPLVQSIYLDHTTEFSGLFSGKNSVSKTAVACWIMTLASIPVGIILAWRNSDRKRQAWIFLTLVNIAFTILSALTFRMITYAILCSLIPIAYVLYLPFILITKKITPPYNLAVRTVFIITCSLWFLLLSTLVFPSDKKEVLLHNREFLADVTQYLTEDPFFETEQRRILTSIYMGPLLLYKTSHEIIGTPSHRNVQGILDTYAIMNASQDTDAYKVIHQRGIQTILIGRPENGIGDFFPTDTRISGSPGNMFHHRLWNGSIPAWLEAYAIPESLQGNIKVFKVID